MRKSAPRRPRKPAAKKKKNEEAETNHLSMESVNPAGQDKTYHHGWGYEPCQWCRQDESMGYDAPSRPKANLRTALQHRPTCSVALPDAPVLALDTTGS